MNDNTAFLDYDEEKLVLIVSKDVIEKLTKSTFYKIRLKSKISEIDEEKGMFYFRDSLVYVDFIKINEQLEAKLPSLGINYSSTQRLNKFIEERNLHIQKRAKLGIELKTDAENLADRYLKYKEIVDAGMSRTLRDKQMQDSFFMAAMTKSGNFSVPGSGKTSSALGVYCYLKSKGLVDKIVMIGPKNAFGSWIDEFKICFDGKEELHCFNIQDPSYHSAKERKYGLAFESAGTNLYLFNYESLHTFEAEISKIVSDKTLLVFDEVHKVKRIDGQYANAALKISSNAKHIIAMTGTPIPNAYIDLYNLLHILYNDEYKEFFNFDTNYLRDPSYDEIELINDKIQPFFCRTTKRELQVPDANEDDIVKISATKEEQELFDVICKKYANNKLALFIRILQIESNPRMLLRSVDLSEFRSMLDINDDIDKIGFIDAEDEVKELVESIKITSKKQRCIEQTKSLVQENKKVIIWCVFKDSIRSIEELLKVNGINAKCIYGEVPLEERLTLIDNFKNGEFDVLITNPHTLAESVSLHSVCHDAIYYEYSYNLVHLLQSKDRIHRLGLPSDQYTQYYFLQSVFDNYDGEEFSMDNNVYNRLKEKEQTMLDAIDNHELEPVYTPEEDLNIIFRQLGL